MATKDFRAERLRTAAIIASGSDTASKPSLLIYSASNASNFTGGTDSAFTSNMTANVGNDVFMFVSGSIGLSGSRSDVTLFGGDIVVSGTIYGEKIVQEVQITQTEDLHLSGGLILNNQAAIKDPPQVGINDGNLYVQTGSLIFRSTTNGSTYSEAIITSVSGGLGIITDVVGNRTALRTDNRVVAHLTGSQFSGNVGVSGTLGVEGNASVAQGSYLYFNGMDGDVFVRSSNGNSLDIDGDDQVSLISDLGVVITANSSNEFQVTSTETTVNANRNDHDFVVNSDSAFATVFVDASDNSIILGSDEFDSSPAAAELVNMGYGNDVKIMLSGTVGDKDSNTRGVVLVPGDIVVSGSYFNGAGENIAKTAGNGIQDQAGSLALNIHDLTGSLTDSTLAHGDLLAVADINAADDETKKISVADFVTSMEGTGIKASGGGTLFTDNAVVAHLTGSQFSGNVGVSGTLGVEGNISIAQGSSLFFNGMDGDQSIRSSDGNTLFFDVDNTIYLDADSEVMIRAGTQNKVQILDGRSEFNQEQWDVDFRINTDNYRSTFFVDGGDNTIIMGHEGFDASPIASEVQGYGADVKIMLSGAIGVKDSTTRGVVLIPGDMVVSGSVFDGSGTNIVKSAGNGLQDDGGTLALNIHDITSSLDESTISDTDWLAVADDGSADDETKKIRVGSFILSAAGAGLESTVAGKLNTNDGIVAHLTGAQFSGNVGTSGDLSVATNSRVYFNGQGGDQFITGDGSDLDIDGDNTVTIIADTNAITEVGTNKIQVTTVETTFNRDGKDHNFMINTSQSTGSFFIDSGDDSIIIGAETFIGVSPNASLLSNKGYGNDVKIMLSGTVGDKDSNNRGVVLVPGDFVVSGSLYDGNGNTINFKSISENGTFSTAPQATNSSDTIAIGNDSQATAAGAYAIGNKTRATGARSIALGSTSTGNNTASGISAAALGGENVVASGDYSVALGGQSNTSSGTHSVSIGNNNTASGDDAIAIGKQISAPEDNSIAIGNNTANAKIALSGSVEVFSDLLVAEHIKHAGDTDTSIRFQDDDITVTAGNVQMLQFTEDDAQDKSVFNPASVDIDFEVKIPNRSAIKADANNKQVLILSGGGVSSNDETQSADVSFFVSGTVGSRNTAVRGTSLFGGDVHVSGSLAGPEYLYFNNDNAYIRRDGSDLKFKDANNSEKTLSTLATVDLDTSEFFGGVQGDNVTSKVATTASLSIAGGLGDNHYVENIGTDTYFFVSGTVNAKDGSHRGVSVFGGDTVISGSGHILGDANLAALTATGAATFKGDLIVSGNQIKNNDSDVMFKFNSGSSNVLMGALQSGEPRTILDIRKDDNTVIAATNEWSNFNLAIRNHSTTTNAFAGIAFDVANEEDDDRIGASISAVRDNATATNHDTNLVFSTNDANDDGNTERMRITHDGKVGIGVETPGYSLDISGDIMIRGDDIRDSGGNIALSFDGSGNVDNGVDFTNSAITIAQDLQHNGDTDTKLKFTTDQINLEAGGVNFVKIKEDTQNEIVFNENSIDIDYRFETNGETHTIFVDGASGRVGFGYGDHNALDTDARVSVKGYQVFKDPASSDVVAFITGSSDHGILELYDNNAVVTTLTANGTSTIGGALTTTGDLVTNTYLQTDLGIPRPTSVLVNTTANSNANYWLKIAQTFNGHDSTDTCFASFLVVFTGFEYTTSYDGDFAYIVNVKFTARSTSPYYYTAGTYVTVEPLHAGNLEGFDPTTDVQITFDNGALPTVVELWIKSKESYKHCFVSHLGGSNSVDTSRADPGFEILTGQTQVASVTSLGTDVFGAYTSKIFDDITLNGDLRLNNNIIQASDGGTAITLDTSDNVTIAGDLTVSGGNIIGPSGGNDLTIESSDDVIIQLDNDNNEGGFFGIKDGGGTTNFQIFEDGSVNQGNGGLSSAFNTYVMGHTGVDGDNGLIIYNTNLSITANDLLGSIGFDANDGNDPSQNSEASVSISAYAIEPFSTSDKGGYMSIATQWINEDDDTVARETMRISYDGVYIHDGTYDVGTAYGGEAEAKARLHVSQSFCGDYNSGQVPVALFRTSETGTHTNLMVLEYQTDINLGTTNDFLVFRDGDSEVGKVNSNGSGGVSFTSSFTGFHASCIENNENAQIGMIVESTGNIWHQSSGSNIDTALPKVTLASVENSKKVYGVISSFENEFPGYYSRSPLSNSEIPVVVNSIGEGRLLVSNIAGNIENGDYIQSSVITGYGKKQADDILRSSTVAKCTENIDWDSVTDTIDHDGSTYKIYLTACTYHCG